MPGTQSIAFVCPRFAEGDTVGGAETLLKQLAVRAATAGHRVSFLTTCARNHFTWENARPAGVENIDGMRVTFFPVNEDRDTDTFLRIQDRISRGRRVAREDQELWLANSVNSREMIAHLGHHGNEYDSIVVGPYLFGLCVAAARMQPDKTLLVPCLHDEPFAALDVFRDWFPAMRGILFNSEPERDLGCRLYCLDKERTAVVGMGIDPFITNADRFRRKFGIDGPYLIYSGRREPLKGTPLLLDYLTAFRARTGKDIKLVLTGSGPVDAPAEILPHVSDLGFVSEQDKHDAMAGAVAFCHPSVNESLGIVLLEAWMAGTCALVHSAGQVLTHHCRMSSGGLWFGNYPEFEGGLDRLLAEPDLGRMLGEQGRQYVRQEYSWERIEGKLLEALDRFAPLPPSPP